MISSKMNTNQNLQSLAKVWPAFVIILSLSTLLRHVIIEQ